MLWLWHRLAAVAPIQPLAWEIPYAEGAALKKKKKKIKIKKKEGVPIVVQAKQIRLVTMWLQI